MVNEFINATEWICLQFEDFWFDIIMPIFINFFLLLGTILIFFLLIGCTDRGNCLKSHQQTYTWLQPIQIGSIYCGNGCSMPNYIYIPQEGIQTICDKWEFPKGKP